MLRIILPVFCFIFMMAGPLQSQNTGFEETLGYINDKLGSNFKVTVERGIILANYYDENHILYREDQVNPKDLDISKVIYDDIEKMFSINCLGGKNQCVDRNLFIHKISRGYSRISFHVSLTPKSAEGLKKAFIHLIRLSTIHNYKSNEPFE